MARSRSAVHRYFRAWAGWALCSNPARGRQTPMRSPADIFASATAHKAVNLSRQDLIELEHALKDGIHEFLPFVSYSLFFPRQGEACPALSYDHAGRELLLPLVLQGETLGVFVARGVRLGAPKTLPPLLQHLASCVLEKP